MTFPIKMNTPQYSITIPSTKVKVPFRPFLVGEQKSMMLSLATQDIDTIVHAIKTIVTACSFDKVDANKLASFDLEYVFLQLRAKSIGETTALTTNCSKCSGDVHFKIDISKAEVDFSTQTSNKIQLTPEIGVIMRYPSLEKNIKLSEKTQEQDEILFETVIDCIESVWNSTEFVNTSDYPRDSLKTFVNSLTVDQMKKLTDFVILMPAVRILTDVTCPHCQENNKILIEGLENFFD